MNTYTGVLLILNEASKKNPRNVICYYSCVGVQMGG